MRTVTCLQHVVADIFSLLSGHIRGTACCQALSLQSHSPLHIGMCVCMHGHVLQQRPLPGSAERENLKKQELLCVSVCGGKLMSPPSRDQRNGRCAILRAHMRKVLLAETESCTLRERLSTGLRLWITPRGALKLGPGLMCEVGLQWLFVSQQNKFPKLRVTHKLHIAHSVRPAALN